VTDRDERLIAEAIDNPNAPKSEQRLVREWGEAKTAYEKSGGPRWRMPIRPILIEPTAEGSFDATFHPYDLGRIREGYGCLRCWQPFETAFPAVCTLCPYPVAERQAEDFAAEFEGPKWVGPSTSLADEFERMLDNGQRTRHIPGSQIILPRGVKL
jgi:hypothetical protein